MRQNWLLRGVSLLVAFVTLSLPLAEGQEIRHVTSDERVASAYESIFKSAGIPLAEPIYHYDSLSFSEDSFSEEETTSPSDSLVSVFYPEKRYFFELDEPSASLQFRLKSQIDSFDSYFQFHLIDPAGNETIYYDLTEFQFFNVLPGRYDFYIQGDGFSSYYLTGSSATLLLKKTLAAALHDSSTFVVDQNFKVSKDDLDDFLSFVKKGGDLIIIAHSKLAEQFGVYFSDYTFKHPLQHSEAVFGYAPFRGHTLSLIDDFTAPDSCASLGSFPLKNYNFLVRFYCLNSDQALSSLIFMNDDIFSIELSDSFSKTLLELLAPPSPVALSATPSFKKTPFFNVNRIDHFGSIILVFLFSVVVLYFFVFLTWRSISHFAYDRFLGHYHKRVLQWSSELPDRTRRRMFFFFVVVLVYFLYDFFFFHKWREWFFILPVTLGVLNFYSFKFDALKLTARTKKLLHLSSLLILVLPLLLISPAARFIPKAVSTVSLDVVNQGNPFVTINSESSSSVMPIVWRIAESAYLFSRGPIQINLNLPKSVLASNDLIRFRLASNDVLKINAIPFPAFSFFSSDLNAFTPLRSFNEVALYRKRSAPLIRETTVPVDWRDFVDQYLPSGSSIGILGDTLLSIPQDFVIDEPIAHEPGFSEIELHSLNSEGTFYTYLEDSFKLTAAFIDPTEKVTLSFYNDKNERLDVSSDWDAFTHVLSASTNKLTPGIYYFRFDYLLQEETTDTEEITEVPLLSKLSVNSTKLIFATNKLNSMGGTFYFAPLNRVYLSYRSALGVLFHQLPHASLIDPTGDSIPSLDILPRDNRLYTLTLPSTKGDFSSSETLFYGFSKESWFNPFKYNFSHPYKNNDYLITQNYNGPFEQDEAPWSIFKYPLKSNFNEYHNKFVIDFLAPRGDDWFLIQNIDVEHS